MGYTTEFKGQFDLDRLPPTEVILQFNEIYDDPNSAPDNPGSYCQWQLTRDLMHLEWDGGEKFYNYTEWLNYLISNVLRPNDIEVSGTVSFSGEDTQDNGIITIINGEARCLQTELIADTLEELKQFKDFILKSEFRDGVLRAWREANK